VKKRILILICLLTTVSWAQGTLSIKGVKEGIIITMNCSSTIRPKPSFALFAGNKLLLLRNDISSHKYGEEIVKFLQPASIKKVNAIRGNEAIIKYGEYGKEGVVEIWLKRRIIKDIPPEVFAEFKSNKD